MTANTVQPASRSVPGHGVRKGVLDLVALGDQLTGVSEAERVRMTRLWTKGDMVRIWDAAQGREVTADAFVPPGVRVGSEIIHEGKNSLPVFNHFQKRFTTADGKPGTVYGYNHSWHNFASTGPGYFVGHHDASVQAFGLDYYQVPPGEARLPPHWPRVRANEIGLQRFIFAKMIDYMRQVCEGVTIGRAWRHGKVTDNYFVLVRTGI